MEREGKYFFTYLYVFGGAELEEKFLNRKYEDMREERDYKKTEWCKTTTDFRDERLELRFILKGIIVQEIYRRV